MPQLSDGLHLDLPDTLPRDVEIISYIFERMRHLITDAKPFLDNLLFLIGEGG